MNDTDKNELHTKLTNIFKSNKQTADDIAKDYALKSIIGSDADKEGAVEDAKIWSYKSRVWDEAVKITDQVFYGYPQG